MIAKLFQRGCARRCSRHGIASRLAIEHLEDRNLLAVVLADWMSEPYVKMTTEEVAGGVAYDVFIKDVEQGFDTPAEWQWTPDLFQEPLVDLSNLHTGFEAGWEFDIFRSDTGIVTTSNAGYRLQAEVLDETVLDVKLDLGSARPISFAGLTGTSSISFAPQFDANLAWQSLAANLALDVELPSKSIPLVPGTAPGAVDAVVGLSAGIGLGFEANLSLGYDLTSGQLEWIDNGPAPDFVASVDATLTGHGGASLLADWLGRAGVRINGTLNQDLTADYHVNSWDFAAPGSLAVTGEWYAGLENPFFGREFTFEAFEPWNVAAWDFLADQTGITPPTTSASYAPPEIMVLGGLSTDPTRPTPVTAAFLAVSAEANSPAGIPADNAFEFTNWKQSGGNWVQGVHWGASAGEDIVGSSGDGVYRLVAAVTDNAGHVGVSQPYYFDVLAAPQPGSALSIDVIRTNDLNNQSDRDGVVEGWERGELEIRLASSADVKDVNARLLSDQERMTVQDDFNFYADIGAGRASFGGGDFDVQLNLSSAERLPLTLYVTYEQNGASYYQYLPVYLDVHPQADYGSFDIVGYTLDDSVAINSRNNGDGVFQSGEKVEIRPLLQYRDDPVAARATSIDVGLPSSTELTVPGGDRRYPDLAPGETAYPLLGKAFTVQADEGFSGLAKIDVQVEWEERAVPITLPGALRIDVQPNPWIHFSDNQWDSGVAAPGETIRHTLTVHNPGTETLHVSGVEVRDELGKIVSDTRADATRFAIMPGQSRDVNITIDTAEIASGTWLQRSIRFISNGRTASDADQRLLVTGLVSNDVPIVRVPSVGRAFEPDVSGPWVVWAEDRAGNVDIFAYNVFTHEERQITTNAARQDAPKISGNLIAWTDYRNGDQGDIYAYDLNTAKEFVISSDAADETLAGVDNGRIAFTRVYHQFAETADSPNSVSNLWIYNHANGQVENLTGFVANSNQRPMETVSSAGIDFDGGRLVWREQTRYWRDASFWGRRDQRVKTTDLEVDSGPQMITVINGWYDSVAVHGDRFVWTMPDVNGDTQVWLWDSGNVSQITSQQDEAHGEEALALGDRHIVYDKASAPQLFYQHSSGGEFLLTNRVSPSYDARMDGDTLVWEASDANNGWGVYFALIGRADLSIQNLTLSTAEAVEGATVSASVAVRNDSSFNYEEDVIVRLFDGDPAAPGAQWIAKQTIQGGLAAKSATSLMFRDLSVPANTSTEVWQTGDLYAQLHLPTKFDLPDNNLVQSQLQIRDSDTAGPAIGGVRIEELQGDGDGVLGADETIRVAWNLNDTSGLGATQLILDGLPVPLISDPLPEGSTNGYVYADLTDVDAGVHQLEIRATDADHSPAASIYTTSFEVFSSEELNVLHDGAAVSDGVARSIDFGKVALNAPAPTVRLLIRNDGEQTLSLSSFQGPAGFVVVEPTAMKVAPGAITSLDVAMLTDTTGEFSGTLIVTSSDGARSPDGRNEATFEISLTGRVGMATTEVVGRHVFYNNSFFDTDSARNPGANDNTAIAPDKVALLPRSPSAPWGARAA